MLLTQGSWDEVRDRLIAYIGVTKLDLTRPDEWIKGITELNGLGIINDLYSMGILVDMSGGYSAKIRKGLIW